MEEQNEMVFKGVDRRSESRTIVDQYSSVEFSIINLDYLYQFKIRETSQTGMGILVREDSVVLKHLKVGDILNMKYYPLELSEQPEYLKTEIKHITKDDQGRFKGHYLVGLSTFGKQNNNP